MFMFSNAALKPACPLEPARRPARCKWPLKRLYARQASSLATLCLPSKATTSSAISQPTGKLEPVRARLATRSCVHPASPSRASSSFCCTYSATAATTTTTINNTHPPYQRAKQLTWQPWSQPKSKLSPARFAATNLPECIMELSPARAARVSSGAANQPS